jgi:hypothetical protein
MASGDVAEQKVISLLQKGGHEALKNEDRETRAFYDVEAVLVDKVSDATLAEFTLEVKNDVYALKSGNVAVEVWNSKSDKPSGLTVTKSDIWVFVVGEEIWAANTLKLREFVDKTVPKRTVTNAGDGNASILLFEKDVIFGDVFERLDELEQEELTTTLLGLLNVAT